MSPQKFLKRLPRDYREIKLPEDFKFLQSIPSGFLIASGTLQRQMRWDDCTPDQKIAVRLPDGRLVIPTVKGEKGT